MYNKLFTKILDSSIWLEQTSTRIVWITLIAAMDEDGYAHFSALENLANRARVSIEECNAAVTALMSPDKNSADSDFEGRRIERVPGGFMVLNAPKYREMASRVDSRESTRLRVQRFRQKKQTGPDVTPRNGEKQNVTPSEAEAYTEAEAQLQISELGKRISKWFRRRETTQWDRRELSKLREVERFKTPEEDIAALESHYLSDAPYKRQDILTLLNNWNGEIDKVRNGKAHHPQKNGTTIPAWRRIDDIDEKINALKSEFSVVKDEGARVGVRNEIAMLTAEKATMLSKK